ncbi:hypothetical protein ACH6EH_07215 [Paenibacillus sp. JSM ZJ436]|uniref:hypothetical protein n=1 Tax=Paenibacillus sp. JSM ZJ436 TaxID=3376190 RepID=UPI0037A4AFEF
MNNETKTIELPIIPREVANAIETARTQGAMNATIIDAYYDDVYIPGINRFDLSSIPFDTLLSALVNGYTTEKSVEELAHEEIRYKYETTGTWGEYSTGYCNGIRYTLDTLKITIEGVNDTQEAEK